MFNHIFNYIFISFFDTETQSSGGGKVFSLKHAMYQGEVHVHTVISTMHLVSA